MPPRAATAFEVEPVAGFADAGFEWDALALASGNPFATLPWCTAWWAAYGAGRTLALQRVRTADGRVVALLPLYAIGRGPLAALRFIGHGAADRLGPICAPEDLPIAAAALGRVGRRPGRFLVADRLADDTVRKLARGRLVRSEPSPALTMDGLSWEAWLGSRSSNFRSQTGRYERRLRKDHDLVFRLTDDPGRVAGDLDTLIDLHDRRWASEGGTDSFTGPRRRLHHDFAAAALRQGWLRLWTAELDGRPAAAWYGLRFAGRDWYYQLGRDPAYDKQRVGYVLLVHTIRTAFEDGMDAYEFGLGDESYKDRFADTTGHLETVLIAQRPVQRAVVAAVGAVERLPKGVGGPIRARLR